MYKVSIIVPVYNNERYIKECIDSIIKQTYENIEIIIINDGSTDKSEDIIKGYESIDNRVVYIKQENGGPSKARNRGIDESTGNYIMFVDSDDTVDKHYVEFMLNEAISKDYDILCCGYTDISKYGVFNISDYDKYDTPNKDTFLELACKGTGGVLWGKIFKKNIITQNNIELKEEIFMCEDLIFILQYMTQCESFGSINKYLYNYNRLNDSSISSNISNNYIDNHIKVCKYIDQILTSSYINTLQINKIISNRIQSLVIVLLELEICNKSKLKINKIIQNINEIISNDYINSYIDGFYSESIIYKPYIYFIKKNRIYMLCLYSSLLNSMKNIKQKFKNRIRGCTG